jgi:hypothetical protein
MTTSQLPESASLPIHRAPAAVGAPPFPSTSPLPGRWRAHGRFAGYRFRTKRTIFASGS